MTAPENPPAFPVQDYGAFQYPGMSQRDWFAGMALAGMCAAPGGPIDQTEMARFSFVVADAMLAEREREP